MKKIFLALFLFSSIALAGADEAVREIDTKRLDLAQAMIKAFDQNFVCDADAYPSEINQLVANSWHRSSPEMKAAFFAKVDPASEMNNDLAFRVAVERVSERLHDQSAEEFAASIVGTVYYKFGQGAYGSPYNVTLQANGVASEKTLELLNEEPWMRWVSSATTWSVRKERGGEYNSERFVLRIGNQDFVMRQQNPGSIWWQPVDMEGKEEVDFGRTLDSSDSYCDA